MAQYSRCLVVCMVILHALTVTPALEARRLHRMKIHSLISSKPSPLCEQAHYIRLCNSLTASLRVASPKSLVDAAIGTAASKAKRAQGILTSLLASPATSGPLKECLRTCKTNYVSAFDSLHKAQILLRRAGTHDDLMNELTSAGTFVETCSDSFSNFPGVTSPIDNVHANLNKLVTNSLNLATTLS